MSPRRTDSAKKPGRLRGAENRSRALALRIAGASTPEIAAELGVTRQHAWRLIDAAASGLAEEIADWASEWRAIQAARIEQDIAHLRSVARQGDLSAYRTVVRLYERQARLLGLDAQPDLQPNMGTFVIGQNATAEEIAAIPSGAEVIDARLPPKRGETIEGEVAGPPGLLRGQDGEDA